MIPWRVTNLVSERLPLLYHVLANHGFGGNDGGHWDERLAETWDDPGRDWPSRNELIMSRCMATDAILDVGCGTGTTLRYLRRHGYESLCGVDISAYAVDRLKAEGIPAHRASILALPFPDASFDVVIAAQVLEHVVRRGRFISELRRVLRPGGRVMIFVPDNCLGPIDEPEHVQKYTRESLRRFVGKHLPVRTVTTLHDVNHQMPVLFVIAEKSFGDGSHDREPRECSSRPAR